jgi:hypothetical protein
MGTNCLLEEIRMRSKAILDGLGKLGKALIFVERVSQADRRKIEKKEKNAPNGCLQKSKNENTKLEAVNSRLKE